MDAPNGGSQRSKEQLHGIAAFRRLEPQFALLAYQNRLTYRTQWTPCYCRTEVVTPGCLQRKLTRRRRCCPDRTPTPQSWADLRID